MTGKVEPAWVMLTRPECHLCEEMALVLERELGPRGAAWREFDVDRDPVLAGRFGEVIPVLLREGVPVAKIRLDPATLRRLIAGRR